MQDETIYYRRHLPHFQPNNATYFVTFHLAGSIPRKAVESMKQELTFLEKGGRNDFDGRRRLEILLNIKRRYSALIDNGPDREAGEPVWLGDGRVAGMIAEAIQYRDGKEYELHAFCIMPNHVHVVFSIGQPDIFGSAKSEGCTESAGTSIDVPSPVLIMENREKTERPVNASSVRRRASSSYRVTSIVGNLKWYTALHGNKILGRTGAFWLHESYDHVVRNGEEFERIVQYVLHNPVKAGLTKNVKDWKWSYLQPKLIDP
jgi:REP element-mobilizing transposase RayT